ncbi:transcription factor E2F8 isoform X2 [Brachyhypopomus gauderio]|uniref:transcription factor E2F8 isoform X2 n=1 Tax=Brachyhypopomus gauderio TaxID=698409 RepID=UPI0040428279
MISPRLYNAVKKRWMMTSILLNGQDLDQKLQISSDTSTSVNVQGGCVEPVKSSGKSSTSRPTFQKNMGPLTTPTKGPDGPAEPWTPTSNLKILISAASPEIRNLEKERTADVTESEEGERSTQDPEQGEEAEKLQLSRKEKSLGLLCNKFLARYPDYPNPAVNNDICLDDVATELNVERRRIYDIMNVLESLNMVSRLAKNRYTWHGRSKLRQTLATLQQVGEEHRYSHQIQQLRQKSLDQEFELDTEEKENEEAEGEPSQKEVSFTEATADSKGASSRKDKSLRVMSQKFVMLFLVLNPRVVSLESAAKILIGEDQVMDQDKSKFKTKIRRLYDIANVLSSLELIKKVHVTEERGRKPAFKWTGPEDLPCLHDFKVDTSVDTPSVTRPLESRASIDNCTKNLFCSPNSKRSFTRHHSLVKLAKSIDNDRRKISSAPSSPIKMSSEAVSRGLYPNKMAHLAAICKMQLEEQMNVHKEMDPKECREQSSMTLPGAAAAISMLETGPPNSRQEPVLSPGVISYLPSPCSSLIPVLLPQPQVGRSYAVYVHHASVKPHPSAKPPPTSLAVRSMTFESPGAANTKTSPITMIGAGQVTQVSTQGHNHASPSLKRACAEISLEGSPSKVRRTDANSKSASPKLGEILQARLKARRGALISSRPSPRALHLDPEFSKPLESRPVASSCNSAPLEHSLETFLEGEERGRTEGVEATPTPLHERPVSTGHMHTETLFPTGYLIPLAQPALGFKDIQSSAGETVKASTPTYNIYHTPTAGSRPPPPQEFTPTSLPLHRVGHVSPFPAHGQRAHSPSPAILNFTLQNLGLIPNTSTPSATPPEQCSPMTCPHPGLPPQGMIFVKPMSPAGPLTPGALHAQPLTLISIQQPLLTTPKCGATLQHSFFHTPVSSLPTITTPTAPKNLYIPQRKLEVTSEDI